LQLHRRKKERKKMELKESRRVISFKQRFCAKFLSAEEQYSSQGMAPFPAISVSFSFSEAIGAMSSPGCRQ